MTYEARNTKRSGAMGDVFQAIGQALSSVTGAVGTAGQIASDPYAGELACRVKQLVSLPNKVHCSSTPLHLPSKARLKKPVIAMRGYVYAEQHPWVYPVAIAAVIGVPFLLGYMTGKKKRSSP